MNRFKVCWVRDTEEGYRTESRQCSDADLGRYIAYAQTQGFVYKVYRVEYKRVEDGSLDYRADTFRNEQESIGKLDAQFLGEDATLDSFDSGKREKRYKIK